MSTVDVSPELRRALKRLCLGKILDAMPERLALAREQKLPFEDVLLMLLSDEIQRRDGTARAPAKVTDAPHGGILPICWKSLKGRRND